MPTHSVAPLIAGNEPLLGVGSRPGRLARGDQWHKHIQPARYAEGSL